MQDNAVTEPRSIAGMEPPLAIMAGTFSDKGLRQFANECIVPALVEVFLRSQQTLRDPVDSAHNVDQP
jgi:hypothetical protein